MSEVRDAAKKYLGVPPFDGQENIARGDVMFARGCAKEHGKENFMAECNEVDRLWNAVRNAFLDLEIETERGREDNEDD